MNYSAFELLVKDYLQLCEYIEPTDDNLETYSHRTYELFVRCCTEFESICKEVLTANGYSLPERANMTDYKKLYTDSQYNMNERLQLKIGLRFWKPGFKFVDPLIDWDRNPLSWYTAYNNVKHSREASFKEASFENLTLSLAAVFLILNATNGPRFFMPYATSLTSGFNSSTGSAYDGSIFTALRR